MFTVCPKCNQSHNISPKDVNKLITCEKCGLKFSYSQSLKKFMNGASPVKLCFLGILLLLFSGTIIWLSIKTTSTKSTLKETEMPAEQKRELLRDLEKKTSEMISAGSIYSVDIDKGIVRINPAYWTQLPNIETKQNCVYFFCKYRLIKYDIYEIKILSHLNDTVLAEYSSWSGMKIYY